MISLILYFISNKSLFIRSEMCITFWDDCRSKQNNQMFCLSCFSFGKNIDKGFKIVCLHSFGICIIRIFSLPLRSTHTDWRGPLAIRRLFHVFIDSILSAICLLRILRIRSLAALLRDILTRPPRQLPLPLLRK